MADLPTGTVTFLFTDIEGSTSRWEAGPLAPPGQVERLPKQRAPIGSPPDDVGSRHSATRASNNLYSPRAADQHHQ